MASSVVGDEDFEDDDSDINGINEESKKGSKPGPKAKPQK